MSFKHTPTNKLIEERAYLESKVNKTIRDRAMLFSISKELSSRSNPSQINS